MQREAKQTLGTRAGGRKERRQKNEDERADALVLVFLVPHP